MSLLRLLTAGKTLVGLRKSEGRYRLPGQKVLPKFGSKKNPFRATVMPEKVEPGRQGGDALPPDSVPAGVTGDQAGTQPAGGSEKGNQDCPHAETQNDQTGTVKQAKALHRGLRRISPVKALLLWGRAKKAKPFGATASRPLVQGELSLDKVKVVRNDLSESDLEVVRAERPAVPKATDAPVVQTAKEAKSESGWGAVAGRLLGARERAGQNVT